MLIWIPRVVLLPAYLVTEYVIRTPVGAVATAAKKGNWGPAVFNFFAFGPDNKGGIFPTFFLAFGFRPSIGLHFFWGDTFVEGNKVTADAAWGGSNWITLAVGIGYSFSKASSIAVEARWNRRPDNLYFGIGPETTTDFKSRYGTDVVGGTVMYRYATGQARVETGAHLTRTVFREYSCCSDPTLAQRVERGELPAPPGAGEHHRRRALLPRLAGHAAARRRPERHPRGRGRRSVGGRDPRLRPLVDQYGAGIEGSWDVTGKGRILSLGVLAEFADPLGSQPVPSRIS